ncbi:MAG: phosphate ABC transporter permease subunit PstC [Limisphaerales bacterium]
MSAAAALPALPGRKSILSPPSKAAGTAFYALTFAMAMAVLALVVIVGLELFRGAHASIQAFGWRFFAGTDWDPVNNNFGALPFIAGTFVTSVLGTAIALPLSLATAIFLTELAPTWARQPVATLVEMLASIPSVVLGLWGIYVMVPWLRDAPFPFLKKHLAFLPFFQGPIGGGYCVFSAAIIIAIMIVPIVTSISREVFRSVPDSQRDAAYALGATRWEATRLAVLNASTRGIFGAAMLGLGRALGETMAVTMVVGNRPGFSASLFAPGSTLASTIANEFAEASDLHLSALLELALALLLVTIVINLLARLLLGALGRKTRLTS